MLANTQAWYAAECLALLSLLDEEMARSGMRDTMKEATKLSRREMLRLSAGSLLAAGLWPGAFQADTAAAGEFHFLVVNDIHYLDKNCGRWLEGVIQQMKHHSETIDFCLLAGDLSEHGKPEQLAAMRDLIRELGKPTYVVVGNHDYLTQKDRKAFEELYPKRLNYHFEHRGWQFVALDTTQGQEARNTSVQEPTLKWLEDNVGRLDKKRPMVVFTHFPLGPWVIGRPKNAEQVLAPFKEYNLQAVFSGHWHGFTERKVGKVVLTTNRCCSFRRQNHDRTKEKGYFLCHAKDGKIERSFIEVKTK
jgi:3',5'-cyclic AMP phosphodiesterase CpdA